MLIVKFNAVMLSRLSGEPVHHQWQQQESLHQDYLLQFLQPYNFICLAGSPPSLYLQEQGQEPSNAVHDFSYILFKLKWQVLSPQRSWLSSEHNTPITPNA